MHVCICECVRVSLFLRCVKKWIVDDSCLAYFLEVGGTVRVCVSVCTCVFLWTGGRVCANMCERVCSCTHFSIWACVCPWVCDAVRAWVLFTINDVGVCIPLKFLDGYIGCYER